MEGRNEALGEIDDLRFCYKLITYLLNSGHGYPTTVVKHDRRGGIITQPHPTAAIAPP